MVFPNVISFMLSGLRQGGFLLGHEHLTDFLAFVREWQFHPQLGWFRKQVAGHLTEMVEYCTPGTFWGVLSQTLCHQLFIKNSA